MVHRSRSALLLLFPLLLPACSTPPLPPHTTAHATVTSASPEATAAGIQILASGGNAIDAAIAVSLTLGVSEPAGSGIGGQVFILLWHPSLGSKVIHGSTRSPRTIPATLTTDSLQAHRATTVPSALRVLDRAHRAFGSGRITWARACQPAIDVAEQGYRRGHFRSRSLQRYGTPDVRAHLAAGPDGRIRRPDLARTLRRIATAGAADFYTGDIAAAIVADMQSHGGYLTAEDLARMPEPAITEPLIGSYRGLAVHTLPPPTGGWVVLRALDVLENADRAQLVDADLRTLWTAESLRIAHGDRARDPIDEPAELQEKLDKIRTRALLRERGEPGIPAREGTGETTHFCVVDGDGMVVAVTQSLNSYYGAKVFAGDLGFLYNDYMREFVMAPDDHPFKLTGDREPYSSMSATIVLRDGKPFLSVGSPGSRRIISAVVQVVSNVIDRGMTIEQAVAAPRVHVVPEEDHLFLERRPPDAAIVGRLEARGFDVAIPLSGLGRERRNPYFGGVHAVALQGGVWAGAADPRRDGRATTIRLPNPR